MFSGDAEMKAMLERWFVEYHGQHQSHRRDDNRFVAEWLHSQLDCGTSSLVLDNIRCLQIDALSQQLLNLYDEFPEATFDSMVQLIHSAMTAQQRQDLLATIVSLDDTTPKSSQSTNITTPTSEAPSPSDVCDGIQKDEDNFVKSNRPVEDNSNN